MIWRAGWNREPRIGRNWRGIDCERFVRASLREVAAADLTRTDWAAFTGLDTTATEISVLEAAFKLGGQDTSKIAGMRDTLVEGFA